MKYAYLDLGHQAAGRIVEVRVRGGATNVLLLSAANFLRYQADRSFRYHGGRYRGRPVRIEVPRDDQRAGAGRSPGAERRGSSLLAR